MKLPSYHFYIYDKINLITSIICLCFSGEMYLSWGTLNYSRTLSIIWKLLLDLILPEALHDTIRFQISFKNFKLEIQAHDLLCFRYKNKRSGPLKPFYYLKKYLLTCIKIRYFSLQGH